MSSLDEIQHALYMFTRTFEQYKKQEGFSLKKFYDGVPFGYMLSSIQYFTGIVEQLQDNTEKWTQRLANLKKIATKMQTYVENECQKILKINDIEFVEIAKNNSQQETIKMFEAIVAVLMQTSEKQDYIQKIMSLDERSQQALVFVVQNAMDGRISQKQNKSHSLDPYQQLTILQNQNQILAQQLNDLCKQNQSLVKQNKTFQQKLHELEQEIERSKNLTKQIYMSSSSNYCDIQRDNSIIETLKRKMIEMARTHQIELTKLNEDIELYKNKISHLKEIEEELIERNKTQQEKMKNFTIAVEEQRRRLQKIIDQKEIKIKKNQYELQISKNKIRELSEDIEVNDLNLRMELQRKEVRFKQLEKQVKNRLNDQNLKSSSKKIVTQIIEPKKSQQKDEQLEYLKVEVQKLRNSKQELQKQNMKLKKKSQKIVNLQNEKKKLQKIVLEVSKCRDSEIEMLVVSLYELRNENIKMHQVIKDLKYRQQSKFD